MDCGLQKSTGSNIRKENIDRAWLIFVNKNCKILQAMPKQPN